MTSPSLQVSYVVPPKKADPASGNGASAGKEAPLALLAAWATA